MQPYDANDIDLHDLYILNWQYTKVILKVTNVVEVWT